MADYTYYIANNEVQLLSNVTYRYERSDEIKVLRKQLAREVVLPFAIYETILSDTEQVYVFEIRKDGTTDWIGEFYPTDCRVSKDLRTISVLPRPADTYAAVLRGWEDKKNVLDSVPQGFSITNHTRLEWVFVIGPQNLPEPESRGYEVHSSYVSLQNEYVLFRESATYQIDDTFEYDPSTELYARSWTYRWTKTGEAGKNQLDVIYVENDSYPANPNYILIASRGTTRSRKWYIDPAVTVIEVDFDIVYPSREVSVVMNALLNDFGLTFESHFFADAFNYVTGLNNVLNYTRFLDMSDFKRPEAGTQAVVNEKSLKEILDDFGRLLNTYWCIDEATQKLCVEHVSYMYTGMPIVDVSSEDIRYNYQINKDSLPVRSRRGAVGDASIDSLPFMEHIGNTTDNDDDTPATVMATDLEAVWLDPSKFDDNLLLLAAQGQGEWWAENAIISGLPLESAHLYTANRQYNYWRHDTPTPSWTMGGVTYNSLSGVQSLKQDEIALYMGDDFNPQSLITTAMGTASIEAAEHDLHTGWWRLSLRYDPYVASLQ